MFATLIYIFMAGASPSTDMDAKHYCVLFARGCHVGGVFAKVSADGTKLLEEKTISWTPQGRWKLFDAAKPGYHISLAESSTRVFMYPTRTTLSPVYEVSQEVYDKACHHRQTLEAGYKYKALDAFSRKRKAVNCLHALSDFAGPLKTGPLIGWMALGRIEKHYKRGGVFPAKPVRTTRVLKLLGLP